MDTRRIALVAAVIASAGLLGGCAVYSAHPVHPGPVVYGEPVAVVPAPVYVAPPPVYYGPSISLGISGRFGHRHHHRHHGHGHHGGHHRHHRH